MFKSLEFCSFVLKIWFIVGLIGTKGSWACPACVQLSDYTFDKILNKFPVTMVKFDVAFPYGDKHEAFAAVAKDMVNLDDALAAEVPVKDYGEKDNEELAKRFRLTKDNFPAIRLFIRGKKKPIEYPADAPFTSEDIRKFFKKETGLHLSLPGCIPNLDVLALSFTKASDDKKTAALDKAKKLTGELGDHQKAAGKIYCLVMQKIIEKGEGFVTTEKERVQKLLAGKLTPEKIKELNNKLNILESFSTSAETKTDEL